MRGRAWRALPEPGDLAGPRSRAAGAFREEEPDRAAYRPAAPIAEDLRFLIPQSEVFL